MLPSKSDDEPMVTKKKSKIPCLSLSSFLPALEAVTAAVTMPGGGALPGTPSAKPKEKRVKIVVALYPFKAIESGDLVLEKGAEYEVIDDSQEHWWKVKDENGSIGYIPSNYVKEKETIGLQKYEWYVGEMSRQRAESLLKHEDKEGCFVVRNSSTKGMYTLSLFTKVWYVGEMSRQRAESLLKHEDKEGCFVVRNSSTKGMYTLSLFTKV
ncbi:hypothetical protein O0L34_g8846 [Tuta absoluta]|nr:hypothetical protein O0L34_g8846 [Tuta absoluta]